MSMSKLEIGTSARVTLTVEVTVSPNWGSDARIDFVHKLASEQAVAIIKRAWERPDEIKHPGWPVRIIGEPKVTAILVNTEQR